MPFVGAAGQLLVKLLAGIGLERDDVYIANVLKCRPPGNRDPQPEEIEACESHLFRQIELIQPKVVATLGNFATKLLSGKPDGITRVHGQEQEVTLGGARVLLYPLFHPAAALYTPRMLDVLATDFARLPALMGQVERAGARRPRRRRAGARAGRAGAARAVLSDASMARGRRHGLRGRDREPGRESRRSARARRRRRRSRASSAPARRPSFAGPAERSASPGPSRARRTRSGTATRRRSRSRTSTSIVSRASARRSGATSSPTSMARLRLSSGPSTAAPGFSQPYQGKSCGGEPGARRRIAPQNHHSQ